MGKIIAISGEKGGTGKSTTAQNIAVYLQKIKHQEVVLLDANLPQRTTSLWADDRNKNSDLTITIIEKSGDLRPTLGQLTQKFDFIVIDCGGYDSSDSRSALLVADLAILTFRPKNRDLRTLPDVEKIIGLTRLNNPNLKCHVLITQCPSLPNQYDRIQGAKASCKSFGFEILNNVTYNRNSYDDCDESGLTVLEFTDLKATEEMTAICDEIWELIK